MRPVLKLPWLPSSRLLFPVNRATPTYIQVQGFLFCSACALLFGAQQQPLCSSSQ